MFNAFLPSSKRIVRSSNSEGILSDNCRREDATDLVKTLGGRVTSAVSGKTDYLVVGEILEDGRPYTEGSKYKKATSINETNAASNKKSLHCLRRRKKEGERRRRAKELTGFNLAAWL